MPEQSTSMMEPMMPSEAAQEQLQALALKLLKESERLKSTFNFKVREAIGDMMRSMNCYYSNFIEGHNTHPIDIERALKQDFSSKKKKRHLQLEAKAHIELQKKIDRDAENIKEVTSAEYFLWLHDEFYSNLPEEMRVVENPETHETKQVVPGEFRDGEVIIGSHVPIRASCIQEFLQRFHERYDIHKLDPIQQVIAVAASHHRFLWIHPFYDGNGRVARLFSHAFLKKIGIGCSLWSISRGLARGHVQYKKLLMAADMPRQGDYDGRGALTQGGLNAFCSFFLSSCVDQIAFMENLLAPQSLLGRIERWTQEQIAINALPKGSFALLREALIRGEFERGQAASITNYKERQARTVLQALTQKALLTSSTPKGAVSLAFPSWIIEDWFPKLY